MLTKTYVEVEGGVDGESGDEGLQEGDCGPDEKAEDEEGGVTALLLNGWLTTGLKALYSVE